MGMVDLEYIGDCVRAMEAGKRLSPYFVPRILPNLAAGHIAIEHGLRCELQMKDWISAK